MCSRECVCSPTTDVTWPHQWIERREEIKIKLIKIEWNICTGDSENEIKLKMRVCHGVIGHEREMKGNRVCGERQPASLLLWLLLFTSNYVIHKMMLSFRVIIHRFDVSNWSRVGQSELTVNRLQNIWRPKIPSLAAVVITLFIETNTVLRVHEQVFDRWTTEPQQIEIEGPTHSCAHAPP